MSGGQDPVAWLRAQVEGDLGIARHILDKRGGWPEPRREMHDAIADCDAKLAIIDRCALLLPPDPESLDEDYQDGRDPGEIMRDEALADFADDILALLADSYRHRPGWAGHWARPSCGKPLHEVPDGHSWGISMQDGTWSCSDPAPRSSDRMPSITISGPPAPGVRFRVDVPPGCTSFGEMPPLAGHGFTTDVNGDRWRSVLRSAVKDPDGGWTLELEIQGRYQED